MKKLFGTDGIRGLANRYPMTPEIALSLGQAIAFYFARKQGGGRILIGKDTRRSSYMFELALSAGISSMGSTAILTGPLPTPGVAFLTRTMRADAGIVISASHNAFEDNGIKFFDKTGYKFPDDVERQMEEFVFSTHTESIKPTGTDIGRAIRIEDAVGRYVEFLKSTFPKDILLKDMKIVVDCANGAAYNVAPMLFSEMEAEIELIGNKPNGSNINRDCGALHPQIMSQIVKQTHADIGIALDGDADRVVICDENGIILNGDHILAMLAMEKKERNSWPDKTVVGTIMSNMGLEIFLKEQGLHFVRTSVGDRYIIEEMNKKGYSLGGEPSGHIILKDISTTGDGLIAALQILSLMKRTGKPLSQLVQSVAMFPQAMQNIRVKERKDLEKIKPLQEELKEVEKELKGKGRIVLRYSGTEPLLRLMIESENDALIGSQMKRLTDCIEQHV
ncbi:MAG TPA: phosphoglucosamine mutase [Deltaproteobacteria bacterium]|nr:phosphoglucosamine mutase [Deltaproteobacteria bacterium]